MRDSKRFGALSTTSKGWGLGLAMGAAASTAIWWLFFRAPPTAGGKAAGYEDQDPDAAPAEIPAEDMVGPPVPSGQ